MLDHLLICKDNLPLFFSPLSLRLEVENFCSPLGLTSNGIASPAIFFRWAAFVYRSASLEVDQPKITADAR